MFFKMCATHDRFVRKPKCCLEEHVGYLRPASRYAGALYDSVVPAQCKEGIFATHRPEQQPLLRNQFTIKQCHFVLDAPHLTTDFYDSNLDWSDENVLAIALGKEIYLRNFDTKRVQLVQALRTKVRSLCWMNGRIVASDETKMYLIEESGSSSWASSVCHWSEEIQHVIRRLNRNTFASGGRSGHISLYDFRQRCCSSRFHSHSCRVCGLAYDGVMSLASGGNDNMCHVWDIRNTVRPYIHFEAKAAIKAIIWAPCKKLVFGAGTSDMRIFVMNGHTGDIQQQKRTEAQVTGLALSSDSRALVSTHGFGAYNLAEWTFPFLELKQSVELSGSPMNRVLQLATHSKSTNIATCCQDEALRIFKPIKTSRPVLRHEADSKWTHVR